MEQYILPDFGGRRSGLERRISLAGMSFKPERRSGHDRRNEFERRIQVRLATGTLKDLDAIKFEKPSTVWKLKK